MDVDVPDVTHQVVGHRERRFKEGHTRSRTRIGRTVVDDGPAKGRDVLVFEGHVPHHDFVNHALKVSASSAVDPEFVQIDVGERAGGVGVLVDQDPVHVLAKVAVVKHGNKMGPSLCYHVAKGLGLVVVKTPLLIRDHVLERGVGTGLIADRKRGGVIARCRGVRPHPLADGKVAVLVLHVHAGDIVASVKPQTGPVRARSPVAVVHAAQGEVGLLGSVVDGAVAASVFKRPVVDEVRRLGRSVRSDVKGSGWNRGLGGVWSLPREDQPVRPTALKELNPEFMKAFGQVDGAGPLNHAVHAVVGDEGLAVDPQLRTVVGIDEKGPISGRWHVDEAAESSAPVVLESVVKTRIGVVG